MFALIIIFNVKHPQNIDFLTVCFQIDHKYPFALLFSDPKHQFWLRKAKGEETQSSSSQKTTCYYLCTPQFPHQNIVFKFRITSVTWLAQV